MIDPRLLEKENVLYEEHDPSYGAVYIYEKHLVDSRSRYQKIDVIETQHHGKILLIDYYMMLTEDSEFIYHEMMAHVPMAAHSQAHQVLVIGGGDGGVVREVLKYPQVERVMLVEIDEEVIKVCREHFPQLARSLDDPRVEVRIEDGVKFVQETDESFDVMIVDSTDPFGVAELLISVDFYKGCRKVLGEEGVMIQQMASPFFTPDIFVKAFHNMVEVFEHVSPVLVPVPFYVSGHWSLGFASSSERHFRKEVSPGSWRPPGELKYYNPEVHRAAFCLPNFVQLLYERAKETPELREKPF